jgi:hypothetical protein
MRCAFGGNLAGRTCGRKNPERQKARISPEIILFASLQQCTSVALASRSCDCGTTFVLPYLRRKGRMTNIRDDKTVEFRFYRPSARQVLLAGEFTGWMEKPIAMLRAGDGWWTTTLTMTPGDYRFRYIADGNWYTDFASHGIEVCKEGWNSVLLIPGEVPEIAMDNTMARSAA